MSFSGFCCGSPERKALNAACFIFLSGGMNFAVSLGWTNFERQSEHFQFCWFIGFIVGALIAAPLLQLFKKIVFFIFSTILITINGIIYVARPFDKDALIAARYLNGFAIGLATVAFLVYASEIASKRKRASRLAVQHYAITIGIFRQIISFYYWPDYTNFTENRFHGIFDIAFGVFGLISTLLVIESPIHHLQHANENEALDCLCRLKGVGQKTEKINGQMQKRKIYVNENEETTYAASVTQGFLPLIKMILYNSLVALSLSLPIFYTFDLSVTNKSEWMIIIFPIVRFLGVGITLLLADIVGRKLLGLLSLACMGGLAISIGILLYKFINQFLQNEKVAICVLSLLFQVSAGIFSTTSSICLGEAFPLKVKSFFIAICVVIEQLIQIGIICLYKYYNVNGTSEYYLCVGIIMIVLVIVFAVTIPETKRTSLLEAQHRFNKLTYCKMR